MWAMVYATQMMWQHQMILVPLPAVLGHEDVGLLRKWERDIGVSEEDHVFPSPGYTDIVRVSGRQTLCLREF